LLSQSDAFPLLKLVVVDHAILVELGEGPMSSDLKAWRHF
jgi:hypothetical protein